MWMPWICAAAAVAGAFPGCWLLTIFPRGRVGERRGQAEGAGHAGTGTVQAAAEV